MTAPRTTHRSPPPRFGDRSVTAQILLGVVVPSAYGACAGFALGWSAPAYWGLEILGAFGAFLSGLEHPGARPAAMRGIVSGLLYGLGVLIARAISSAPARASLPHPHASLVLAAAIAGGILSALGGLRRTH